MLAVRLDPEIEEKLNELAKETGRTKTYYVKLALERFLEDEADYLLALQRMNKKGKRYSIEEAKKLIEEMDD